MKNPEDAIDKVFAGLRDVDTPVGMEGRILGAIEEKASTRAGLGWRMLLGLPAGARYVACGVAVAGLLAVGLAIPAIRRIGRAPAQARLIPGRAGAETEANTGVNAKSVRLPVDRSVVRSAGKPGIRRSEAVRESNSVAVQEMHAASSPAPSMPLTQQETLLLRIAHRRAPEEMAMLNPVLRAARDREDKADVRKFFEP